MRIDLNREPQSTKLSETNRSSAQNTWAAGDSSASNALAGPTGEDQTELSGAHAQVLALVAQASQLPEIRQERVQSLRQAIHSGEYQSSPEKVAGAMYAYMIDASAA